MARPSGSRGSDRVATAILHEIVGALTALALAIVALRHVIATARVSLLWYDADSVLLPLVERGMRLGQAFEWAMSPALFFFPELPVYVVCAAVTATPQQALALNGVLVLCAVYALVRVVAAQLMPSAARAVRIAVSVLALGVVTVLVLTESTATTNSLELASLLLTTTYYYGVVLAMLATAALALRVVRTASLPEAPAGWGALVTIAVVAACTTTSNPLYVPWSAAPVVLTVGVLALARRVPWRVVVTLGVALGGGSTIGYLLRIPLRPFVSLDPSTYVHPEFAGRTLAFFAALTDDRASSAAGDAELLLLFLGLVLGVGGMVWAWRVRTARTVLVATTLSTMTTVVVSVGVIVAGSETARYLEPIATIPLVALVAVAELARTTIRRTRVSRPGRGFRLASALVAAMILAVGVAVTPATVTAVRTAAYAPAACLDRWAAGRGAGGGTADADGAAARPVEGVGQFWTVRPLAAYADSDVELLQVRDSFDVYPWLVNLAPYAGAHPTFVLVGSRDVWTTPIEDVLGEPADIVHCSGYDIYDYAGTAGATTLRQQVVRSADLVRIGRGFGA